MTTFLCKNSLENVKEVACLCREICVSICGTGFVACGYLYLMYTDLGLTRVIFVLFFKTQFLRGKVCKGNCISMLNGPSLELHA